MVTSAEEDAIRAVMLAKEPIGCRLSCPDCDTPIVGTGWTGEEAREAAQVRLRHHLDAVVGCTA